MDNYNEYEYEEQRDEFGRTHESILCSHCCKHIRAGDTLYNINKLPFCCSECVLNYVGASKLWFDANDGTYKSMFPKKEL